MLGKKYLLANFLYHSYLTNLFRKYPLHNKLIILNYHRIKQNDSELSLFDDGVFTTDVTKFTHQMLWLKENTNVITESELIRAVASNDTRFSGEPTVLITFDDGYADNYHLAYPILKTLGVPAIFFLTSQMLDQRTLCWWDYIAYMVKKSTKQSIAFENKTFFFPQEKSAAIQFFLETMKTRPASATSHLLNLLSELLDVDFPTEEEQDNEIMTWDNVREMQSHGMQFGAHTHTHRVLTTLSDAEIREELLMSRLILEKELNTRIESVSYPVGEAQLVPSNIDVICKECGYVVGYTTNSGVNTWDSLHRYAIKRTAYFLENVSTVSIMILFPEIFHWQMRPSHRISPQEKTFADTYYQQGLLHLGQAQTGKAIIEFQKALDINPEYLDARIKIALSFITMKDPHAALSHLQKIMEKYSHFPDLLYYCAIAYAQLKDFEQTQLYLEKAISCNPRYAAALSKLAMVYCYFGEHENALHALRRHATLQKYESSLDPIVLDAEKAYQEHGKDSSEFKESICPFAITGLSLENIISDFYLDISLNPNMSELSFLVSRVSKDDPMLESLVLLFEEHAQQFNSFPDSHFALGQVYARIGQDDKAENCFISALKLNNNFVRGRVQLFKLYHRQKKWSDALHHGEILLQYGLPYPDIYTELAETCFAVGKHVQGEQFAKKALAINPQYQAASTLLSKHTPQKT